MQSAALQQCDLRTDPGACRGTDPDPNAGSAHGTEHSHPDSRGDSGPDPHAGSNSGADPDPRTDAHPYPDSDSCAHARAEQSTPRDQEPDR